MGKKSLKETIKDLEKELKKCESKAFKVLFFVIDSKGKPSGSLAYIYETAYQIKQMGYNVMMMYAEKDFVGVGDWMGQKYADLPHINSEKEQLSVSPSDILFIPEIFTQVMIKTKELPCKRVVIFQNYKFFTDMMPVGRTFEDLKIRDCIVPSDSLAQNLRELFPTLQIMKVNPKIDEMFKAEDKPRKLLINVVSNNQSDVFSIIKPFQWKYPMYSWVAIRNIGGLSREEFASALKEGFATIWLDSTTDFGYTPLEAMAVGNIVMGKIPEDKIDWLYNEKGEINDNGLWFYNINDGADILASIVETYLHNGVGNEIFDNMRETVNKYPSEQQYEDIKKVYVDGIFERRKKEIETVITALKNNKEKEEK